ncbi:MAG: MFS transporter [archaeon]
MKDQGHSLRLLILVQLFFWLRGGVIAPVLALFFRSKGITVTEIGLLMMARAAGWLIFEPLFGFFADKLGKKRLTLFSISATSLVYLSFASADTTWHFYLAMFAMSSTMAAGAVSIRAILTEVIPASGRGRTYGRYMAIVSLGQITGPLLGGVLADTVGYVAPFYAAAGIGIISFAALFPMEYHESPTERRTLHEGKSHRSGLLAKSFLGLLLIRMLYMFNMNFEQNTFPIFLHETERFSASQTEIGVFMGILRMASALSQPSLGALADRIGAKKLIVSGLSIGGLTYLTVLYISGTLPIYVLAVVQGVFFGAAEICLMVHLMMIMPKGSSAKAMGVYGFAEDIGGIIASPLLGSVYDSMGPSFSIISISAIMVCDGVLSIFLVQKTKAKDSDTGTG